MFTKLSGIIGFTQAELKALIFLITIFLTGLSYKYLVLNVPSEIREFNYSLSDSMFNSANSDLNDNLPAADAKNIDVDYKQEVLDFNKQNFAVKKRIDLLQERSINLNNAQLNDLIMLPGIGEATAKNIINYREYHGKFRKLEELMNVKRIGEKRFNQIKKYLFID